MEGETQTIPATEPNLRFEGFAKHWKTKPFGKLFRFISTNSLSRDALSYDKGATYNLHYGDIHTKFSASFKLREENVPWIDPERAADSFPDDRYCRIGDLVIADASEDYNDIGKCIEVVDLDAEKVVAGLHTLLARPLDSDSASGFSAYLMQTWNVRHQIMVRAQGTKVLGISTKQLAHVSVCFPTLPEQQKIAGFLSAVDAKIQQLTRKKALLEQYKKGVMQQLFNQAIRFTRADGAAFPEWEEKRLGEVCKFTKGKGVSKADIAAEGATKCIRYGELYTTYAEVIDEVVSRTNVDPSQLFMSKQNDVIIPSSGETQLDIATASCVMHDGIALGGDLNVIRTKQNGVFLAYYLNGARRNQIAKLAQGNSVVHLYSKQLADLSVDLPCLEEQEKIAGFLRALDARVQAVQAQVEGCQKWKKGLLQQLFV